MTDFAQGAMAIGGAVGTGIIADKRPDLAAKVITLQTYANILMSIVGLIAIIVFAVLFHNAAMHGNLHPGDDPNHPPPTDDDDKKKA